MFFGTQCSLVLRWSNYMYDTLMVCRPFCFFVNTTAFYVNKLHTEVEQEAALIYEHISNI